jgi:hypothetical protein
VLDEVNETYREAMDRLSWRRIRIITEHAEARGVAWLKSCLSPEQLADYDRTRSFVVIGGTTGHRYRICWGISQNIIRLEIVHGRERAVERLCFGPRGVPIGDILLQQKIALEGDEQAALRIAGRSPVPDPRANYAVFMGPDGPVHMDSNGLVHVDSNGQPAQVGMEPRQVRMPQREFVGWNTLNADPGEQTN